MTLLSVSWGSDRFDIYIRVELALPYSIPISYQWYVSFSRLLQSHSIFIFLLLPSALWYLTSHFFFLIASLFIWSLSPLRSLLAIWFNQLDKTSCSCLFQAFSVYNRMLVYQRSPIGLMVIWGFPKAYCEPRLHFIQGDKWNPWEWERDWTMSLVKADGTDKDTTVGQWHATLRKQTEEQSIPGKLMTLGKS